MNTCEMQLTYYIKKSLLRIYRQTIQTILKKNYRVLFQFYVSTINYYKGIL